MFNKKVNLLGALGSKFKIPSFKSAKTKKNEGKPGIFMQKSILSFGVTLKIKMIVFT